MRHILIFFGPTGVGKSSLAEKIAQKVPAEIVNMDMGQLYEPLSIGTAKPDWKNSSIRHHLFDVVQAPKNFTVVEYRNSLLEVLNDIWSRNRLPLVVGGSAFYLKSIFFPLHGAPSSAFFDGEGVWDDLHAIDPIRAAAIHPHDDYRIKRALAIWRETGKKPSDFIVPYNPPCPYTLLFINRERDDLYRIINDRVHVMIEEGWIDEVKALRGTEWEGFLRDKKIIGYSDLFEYLSNENANNLQKTIETIQQKTRNYAKRQITFWRMLERQLQQAQKESGSHDRIEAINLTLLDHDLYINQLLCQISGLFK